MTMTDEKITPALSEQEWRYVRLWDAGKMIGGAVRGKINRAWSPDVKHAVAAQCLHGEPFGFTHEDVAFLRRAADSEEASFHHDGLYIPNEVPGAFRSLADRIAALLPPNDTA